MMIGWREEKERLLELSVEDRREVTYCSQPNLVLLCQGYHCGSGYIPLSDVPTWKMQELYNSKLNREKVKLTQQEKEKIEKKLFADLEVDRDLDLSEKVNKILLAEVCYSMLYV